MFRVTVCQSSGETTVSMRHLVFVTVWMIVWYAYQSSTQWQIPNVV